MASEAALADRSQQVAERAIAEKIEALVGDLEPDGRFGAAPTLAGPTRILHLRLRRRRRCQVALPLELVENLLNQPFDALLGVVSLLPVLAEQLLDHLVGEHSSVEQRLEDGIVQSLARVPGHAVVVREAVGVVEAARQQEVGELREQLLEIEVVEILAGELGVAVFKVRLSVVVLLLVARQRDVAIDHRLLRDIPRGAARRLGTLVVPLVRARDLLLRVETLEDEVHGGRDERWLRGIPDAGVVGQLVQALDIAGAPQELRRRQRIVDLQAAPEVEPLGDLTEIREAK